MTRWEKMQEIKKSYRIDDQGNYTYRGQWYAPGDLKSRYNTYRRLFIAKIAAGFVLLGLLGFIPAGPMLRDRIDDVNYIVLVFGLEAAAFLAETYFEWKILKYGMKLPEYDMHLVRRCYGLSVMAMVFAIVLALAQAVYMITAGMPEDCAWDTVWLGLAILFLIICVCFVCFLRKIRWDIYRNNE